MNRILSLGLTPAILLFAWQACAESYSDPARKLYRWTGPEGETHFSDRPPDAPVTQLQVQTVPPVPSAQDTESDYYSVENQARRLEEERRARSRAREEEARAREERVLRRERIEAARAQREAAERASSYSYPTYLAPILPRYPYRPGYPPIHRPWPPIHKPVPPRRPVRDRPLGRVPALPQR